MTEEVVVNDLAATAAQAAEAASTAEATAASDGAPSSGESQPGENDKPKTFTQSELDDIVQKRIAKEQRKAQRDSDRRVAEAIAQAQPKQAPKEEAAPTRPAAKEGETAEDYLERLAEWKAEQIIERKETARVERDRVSAEQRQQREVYEAHSEREDTAKDKYADYEDVVSNPKLPINAVMADTIRLSDQGPEIAYYLGKHPDEAAKIAKLPPILAVKELGKLEVKLAAEPIAPTKRSSSAPEPITPVRPAGGSTYTNLDDPKALKALGTSGLIAAWDAQARKQAQKNR